ncbi:MAG: peptide/nickel transport system permease protein [Halobacteriales archaeon]|jgi:peptide/nickel transport system permease protein
MSRFRYILKRLLLMIPVVIFGTSVTFIILYAGPIDPATVILGQTATPAQRAALRAQLGLNQPLWGQYIDFLVNMLTLDLGQSWVIQPETGAYEVILNFLPRTVWMGLWAVTLPIFVGIPLGFYAGMNPNTFRDYFASFGGIVWRSMPRFWLAVILMVGLSRSEAILFGFNWTGFIVESNVVGPPPLNNLTDPHSLLVAIKMVLPAAIVLGNSSMGNEMRVGRTAFLEVKNSNYVEMARAKGVPGRSIVWKHIFRNALMPLVPLITAEAVLIIAGSVLIETVFGINGIGWLFFQSMIQGDIPLAGALMFFFIIIIVGMNLVQDILYTIIDPRVSMEEANP